MYKTEFYNKKFYWFLIIVVIGLFLKTVYSTFANNQSIGIGPMILQFLLVVLIVAKHRYARISIIVWVIAFLLLFSVFQLLRQMVQNIKYGIDITYLMFYLLVSVNVILGSIILFYTIKTTKVIREE